MKTNSDSTIARRLRNGETLYGLIVKMPGPATVEQCGYAGFDFVVLDTEHGAAGSEILEHHLRAADSAGIEAVVRVGSSEPVEVLRALDAGASGIVVPHVNDVAAARAAVRAAHYPPAGTRGLAVSTRAGRHGANSVKNHVRYALENTLVVVQVEHAEALDHVPEIASSDRVDAVFLGPSDLAMSLGHPGNPGHKSVAAAIDRVARAVAEADGVALCVLAGSEEEACVWEGRGARVVLFSVTALLGERLDQVVSRLRAKEPSPLHADADSTGDGMGS